MADEKVPYYNADGELRFMPASSYRPGMSGVYSTKEEAQAARQKNAQTATGTNLDADYNKGYERGQDIFYNDPDMQDLRARQEDLAKGYSSEELGAKRASAREATQASRSNYLKSLQSRVGRAGIGGARAAAMQAEGDKGFQSANAESERKMLLDDANLTRTGTQSLQDFIFRQKYGALGSAIGEQQAGLAERGKYMATQANNSSGGGMSWFCTEVHKHQKWTMGEMKSLKKLEKYARKQDPASAEFYFDNANVVVDKMNEKKFNWTDLIPCIKSCIDLVNQKRMADALNEYVSMAHGLASIYWR